jgi:hypothetical protein
VLTILVFEIKEGKNAQKVKKNINRNLSITGIILRGKFFKFETRKCYFLQSEHPKNNKIINNNLSSLSSRKTEQFKSILLNKDKGSSLVCLYNFREKGPFLGGTKCDFVGGHKGRLGGHLPPQLVC